MRKVAIITLSIFSAAILISCSASKSASNGYHGVNNQKAVNEQHKEFQKPKHKLHKVSPYKTRN